MSPSTRVSPAHRFPPGVAVRRAAATVLLSVREGSSLKAALPGVLGGLADPRDRALCESLCFHSLRHWRRYDDLLCALLDKPLPPAMREVYALLLIGLAQLDALGLAEHAAVAATVEAVRVKHPRHAGLANAILRRFLRERESLAARYSAAPALRYSHPDWLYQRLAQDWPEDVLSILSNNITEAPVWVRVNQSRVEDTEKLRTAWRAQGVESEASPEQARALKLIDSGQPILLVGASRSCWWDGRKATLRCRIFPCRTRFAHWIFNRDTGYWTPAPHPEARPCRCMISARRQTFLHWMSMHDACDVWKMLSGGKASKRICVPSMRRKFRSGGTVSDSSAS